MSIPMRKVLKSVEKKKEKDEKKQKQKVFENQKHVMAWKFWGYFNFFFLNNNNNHKPFQTYKVLKAPPTYI